MPTMDYPMEQFAQAYQAAAERKAKKPGFGMGFATSVGPAMVQELDARKKLYNDLLTKFTTDIEIVGEDGKPIDPAQAAAYVSQNRKLPPGATPRKRTELKPQEPNLVYDEKTGFAKPMTYADGTTAYGNVYKPPVPKAEPAPKSVVSFDPFSGKYYKPGTREEIDISNIENPVIRNLQSPEGSTGRIPPASQLGLFNDANRAVMLLESALKRRREGNKGKGISTGILEPRNYRSMVGQIGMQVAGDPERAKFLSDVNQAQDIYRKFITGAAAGFPEIKFLSTAIPTASGAKPEIFDAMAEETLQNMKQNIEMMRKSLTTSGYTAPSTSWDDYSGNTPETTPPPTTAKPKIRIKSVRPIGVKQ